MSNDDCHLDPGVLFLTEVPCADQSEGPGDQSEGPGVLVTWAPSLPPLCRLNPWVNIIPKLRKKKGDLSRK